MNTQRKFDSAISGNNAIKLEKSYTNQNAGRNEESQQVNTNRRLRVAQRVNPVYTLALTLIIALTLAIAVILLKAQFVVSDNAERIIALQQNLLEIKKQNEQLESDIKKSINMEEVYKIATQELGMVQAGKGDIKYIDANDLSYTVQYTDIQVKEEKEDLNISNILGFISKGW